MFRPSEIPPIPRKVPEVVIQAFHAGDAQEILKIHRSNSGTLCIFASDLSLGPARANHVAREFYEITGIAWPLKEPAMTSVMDANSTNHSSYKDLIGNGVDNEAKGEAATQNAYILAATLLYEISGYEKSCFLVLIPRFESPWDHENLMFIRFFSEGIITTPHSFFLVNCSPEMPEMPEGWKMNWANSLSPKSPGTTDHLLALVPGIISPEIRDSVLQIPKTEENITGITFPISNGYFLIDPIFRNGHTSRFAFDRLSGLKNGPTWLRAFACFKGNNYFLDTDLVSAEGSRNFSEGGVDLALRQMQRAADCAGGPLKKAIITCQLQGFRIASLRFEEAASASLPGKSLPQGIRAFLLQAIGWGKLMTHQIQEALELFEMAAPGFDALQDSGEAIYFHNIFALSRLRSGDWESAYQMEIKIEQECGLLSPPDFRLIYINSINLARLLRKANRLEESLAYYQKAFSTTLGVRSEGDLIFTNFTLGQLYQNQGNFRDAFFYFLKAAIHWLACAVPEAINKRVLDAITGFGPRPLAQKEEITARHLHENLLAGAEQYFGEMPDLNFEENPPCFAYTHALRIDLTQEDTVFAVSGNLGNFFVSTQIKMQGITGPENDKLRSLTWFLLRKASPVVMSRPETIFFDHGNGTDLAHTSEELVSACLRLGINRLVTSDETWHLPDIKEAIRQNLVWLTPGAGVAKVRELDHHTEVTFKRYLSPVRLAGSRREWLIERGLSESGAPIFLGPDDLSHLDRILEMEKEKIITLGIDKKSWKKVGIKLPTKENSRHL